MEKYEEWKKMNRDYIKEINRLVQNINPPNNLQIISYFTHSLNISHTGGFDSFCIGSFHIRNVGTHVLNNPFICIRIESENDFDFSGKYVYQDSIQKKKMSQAWERINDSKEKHEYWLRPNEIQSLDAGSTISFPNFQLKWKSDLSYTFRVNGFVYGDELKEGSNSLNDIHLRGTNERGR
ncbi:hypothetical protein [Ornithinibacillus scapharcae]|uniref:hypothetical protein n=1 Tax=Ornithinibacillus scapharcae TaxID=1147159 RepID=UPI000225AB43|nr:hypothetical protein [Ornithinibacillus scapharcae]